MHLRTWIVERRDPARFLGASLVAVGGFLAVCWALPSLGREGPAILVWTALGGLVPLAAFGWAIHSGSTAAVEAVGWGCVALAVFALTFPHGGGVLDVGALYLCGAILMTVVRLVTLAPIAGVPPRAASR